MPDANVYNRWAGLLAAAALVFGGAGSALADGADRGPRHDPAQRMTRALELSPEQQQDIAALYDSHRQWMRENLRDADGQPVPEARRQAREAREALQAEIRLRLTDEQRETLDGMQRPRRGGTGPRGRGRMPMGALRSLDLSDEQAHAIRDLMQAHRDSMRAARQSASGRGESDAATRGQRREAAREAMQALRTDVHAVLTPEQREQLQQARPQRGGWRDGGGHRRHGERHHRGRDNG